MNVQSEGIERRGEIDRSPSLQEWCQDSDLRELAPGQVAVWMVDLDGGLRPDDVEVADPGPELGLLDDIEKARAGRFVRARDRRRFARCRASLRQILGGLLGESPRSLRFRAVGQGKPEIDFVAMGLREGEALANFRFNVSHSSDLALIAVSRGRELGVDLERVRNIAEADRIVGSFFSPAEQVEFAGIASNARDHAFFRGWTRKEAVLKGLGIGLAGLAAHYETGFGTEELPARFVPALPAPRVKEWELWEAAPRSGFVATVALLSVPSLAGATGVVATTGDDAVH